MSYILYKITREDGQLYIGTTYKDGFKRRMKAHSKTNRFKDLQFSVNIIEESDDYEHIMSQETHYIKLYNTFHNGLNGSINGKGNHLCTNFTTKGFVFSEETKLKMSNSARRRIDRDGVPFKGLSHSDETKLKLSELRKGKRWSPTKLTEDDVDDILNVYHNIKPEMVGVGMVMKNGRCMSYERAFSVEISKKYNVTPEAIYAVVKGKAWKDVQRKYKI